MGTFRQIGAVTAMNLSSVPSRIGASSVVVIGIACVVGVVISVFGMTRSLTGTLRDSARPDRAVVLRSGASNETASTLLVDAIATIKDAPGIARTPDGDAAASAEMMIAVSMHRKEDDTMAGVTVRGIEPAAATVRPEVRLVDGRMFRPGLREAIVGRGANGEFKGLGIGDQVALRDSQWTIVGTFESGGDAQESRLLVDESTLLSAYQRTAANSLTALLESEAAFDEFKAALTTNPTLSVSVERETEYYARQSKSINQLLDFVTYFVGGIMALGALFAALNTMYSAVSTRAVEIATLRALGFGSTGVVVSVLAESLLLAAAGAAIGAAVSWLWFGGNTFAMGNGTSSLVVKMQITPALLATGMVWAVTVGFFGGLFPALRAARLPVARALRAV
ncbi:MAG TPA: ABC transporter permease [Gammaproteobacteria bacterium]|nr:ABC transporter permease [Gammaproteobacteria bacterium]